jgi:hypothetical protein
MEWGIVPHPDGEPVDPVNGFDLKKSTITIDSGATNFAMGFSHSDH